LFEGHPTSKRPYFRGGLKKGLRGEEKGLFVVDELPTLGEQNYFPRAERRSNNKKGGSMKREGDPVSPAGESPTLWRVGRKKEGKA